MKKSQLPIIKQIPDFLDYLDIEKGLSTKTQENYARFLHHFVSWLEKNHLLTDLLPHQLTAKHIWDYRVYLSRGVSSRKTHQPLKKNTQNYYLIALRALLSYFADKDILALPADKIKLAKQPKDKKIHFLKLDEVRKLLDAPSTIEEPDLRDKAILETLFSTGTRVSELAALNREQFSKIKNKNNFLELAIIGKGNKPRTVYFSTRCLKWLNQYLAKRTDIDPALFISYHAGAEASKSRRLSTRAIEKVVKKHTKIAGLSLLTTPHTLRHSYATDLLMQGVDLRLVQEFLGHSSISSTQIYTHVTNKKLRDVYLKFHGGKDLKK